MAEQFTLNAAKTSSLRRHRSSTGAAWTDNWMQAKGEEHMLSGYDPNNVDQYRHLLQFTMPDWTNVERITKAELHFFTAGDHAGLKTSTAKTPDNLKLAVKKTTWTEAGGGEKVWTGALPDGGAEMDDTYRAYVKVSGTNLNHNIVSVMALVRYWAGKGVKTPLGNGLAKSNYGMVLTVSGSTSTMKDHETVTASPKHSNAGIHPYLLIEYTPKGGPGLVVLGAPDGTITAGVPHYFTGTWEPGRPGDKMVEVQFKLTATGQPELKWTHVANPNEVATSSFSVLVPASVKSGITYAWTALVKTAKGDVTPYPPTQTVRLASSPPSLVALGPTGSKATLDSVPFSARYTASAGQYRASAWQVQMRTPLVSTDPTWGEDLLWDTGLMTVASGAERSTPVTTPFTVDLKTLYGGPALTPGGTYNYRMRALDPFGSETGWKYGAFSLTSAYVPPTDDPRVNMTRYGKPPPHRIRIYAMGTGRGPGKLLAELTDAANVGASEYYNSAGEFYFTLPAIHPQVAVIEPYQVHYELQLHTGQGWKGKAFGLITDFDATEDEVVFYGQDYMGLLARTVEERFSTADAELSTDKGGAKYVEKTIKDIVVDQLTKEKAKANSPIGFININAADVAAMPEQATIYASFKQRLPFLAGLIDSSRAGTGKRTRLVPERNSDGVWKWRVIANPGLDRPNIRLEYGGLVQGFRTIPFSDWGTAVDALGRTVTGTKVYSARAVAPGISESTYGAFPSTTMYQDIDDSADLQRRANQAAAKVAKVGKMLGLGIRVGSLSIKDGWDICDSVKVDIVRGVVDTSRFGSGYWTIWGWTWNSYPDGHSNLVLSLSPREDTTPPNPDLIQSKPILDLPEWQLDSVPPTVDDDGIFWLDTSTGDVYEKQPDGTWVVTGNMQGPPGAGLLTRYVWKQSATGVVTYGQVTLGSAPGAGAPNILSIHSLDGDSVDHWSQLRIIQQGDALVVTAPRVTARSGAEELVAYRATVTGPGVDHTDYWSFPVTWPEAEEHDVGAPTSVGLGVAGPQGAQGVPGVAGPAGPAGGADTSAPDVPVIKGTPTSSLTQQEDGSPSTAIAVVVGYASPPVGLTDLAEYILQSTRFPLVSDATQPDWTLATQWTGKSLDATGTADVTIVQPGAVAATPYWMRAAAVDKSNNKSGWSTPAVKIDTVGDDEGPPQPKDIIVAPGMSVFGVRWSPIPVSDFAYVEVQWRVASPVGNWVSAEVPGTVFVAVGLTNGTVYDVRLRSVDRSGNTLDADTLTYKVDDAASAEKGWVIPVPPTVTPAAIPGSALVWDQAIIDSVFAGKLNADWIVTGNLKVGQGSADADAITVYDAAGNVVGRWTSANGIEMFDPVANPTYKMTLDESGLFIWDTSDALNPFAVVSITPLGIDAASIRFGSARGGHNLVQNSSFELGAFGVTVVTPNKWDLTADFTATRNGADINITITGGTTLTMTPT